MFFIRLRHVVYTTNFLSELRVHVYMVEQIVTQYGVWINVQKNKNDWGVECPILSIVEECRR